MAGSFTALHYHIIFSTKERRPFITPDLAPRLHAYMGGVVNGIDGQSLRIGGASDHVHIAARLDKKRAIADSVREIKTATSKWVHEQFRALPHFGWQNGYAAFSISLTDLPRVIAYIDGQEEHHRAVPFQEEFLAFLHEHDVPYDPRYIWE